MSDFKKLIDNSKFQVFLMINPASLPWPFATHSWLVINNMGKISRWEISNQRNMCETSWDFLHRDLNPDFRGTGVLPYTNVLLYKAKLIGYIEGDKGSSAENTVKFVLNSPRTYPYAKKYSFLGPNSNTYPQWVLDNNPEFNYSLPWNAIGKRYRVKASRGVDKH